MKKIISLIAIFATMSVGAMAQTEDEAEQNPFKGVDNIAKKEHIANKKGIPYVYVREADVMWAKTIWRMIDLRERINLPLYYPVTPLDGRRSVAQVIIDALSNGDLQAYNGNSGFGREFEQHIDYEVIENVFGAGTDTVEVQDPNTGLITKSVVKTEVDPSLVKKLLLKEVWYFDRKYTRMDVRIIGICPVIEAASEDGSRIDQKLGCWIYFPELRPFLMEQEAYNTRNDMQRDSFDDLFAKRRFGSYVYSEANVYNNRTITEMAQGNVDTNIEAERIKQLLFQKEHDVWEF